MEVGPDQASLHQNLQSVVPVARLAEASRCVALDVGQVKSRPAVFLDQSEQTAGVALASAVATCCWRRSALARQ